MPLSPVRDKDLIVERSGHVGRTWLDWFITLRNLLNWAVKREQTVRLTAQGAAIATTNIPLNTLSAGLYRLSWYVRVTRAATTSSSVQLTLGWTDGSVALTKVGANVNGNTTASYDSDAVLIRVDKDSAMTYSATYASTGATSMQFEANIVLEQVPS